MSRSWYSLVYAISMCGIGLLALIRAERVRTFGIRLIGSGKFPRLVCSPITLLSIRFSGLIALAIGGLVLWTLGFGR